MALMLEEFEAILLKEAAVAAAMGPKECVATLKEHLAVCATADSAEHLWSAEELYNYRHYQLYKERNTCCGGSVRGTDCFNANSTFDATW